MNKVEVLHVVDVERVELVAYQLKSVARTWIYLWNNGTAEGEPHPSLACYEEDILWRFFLEN